MKISNSVCLASYYTYNKQHKQRQRLFFSILLMMPTSETKSDWRSLTILGGIFLSDGNIT